MLLILSACYSTLSVYRFYCAIIDILQYEEGASLSHDSQSFRIQDGALRDLRAAGVKRLLNHCTYLEDPLRRLAESCIHTYIYIYTTLSGVCVAVRARFSRINMRFFTVVFTFFFNFVDTSCFEMY